MKSFIFSKILLFIVFCHPLFSTKILNCSEITEQKEPDQVCLTIFIHGIIKTPWTLGDLLRMLQNNVANSRYARTTEYLRDSGHYYLVQPMQEVGFHPVVCTNIDKNASCAMASLFEICSFEKANHLFYTFGWSGLLSRFHREEEALNLFKAINKVIAPFKSQNVIPKIRIIAFSHGGNVVLNMPKFVPCDDIPFIVDELVLLGTPIQRDNDSLINHSIFKNIYNFYSEGDIAQTSDFLTTQYGSSSRIFKGRKDFKLPSKLKQIKVLTTKLVVNKKGKIIKTSYSDPRHSEMWYFGWSKRTYRGGFPLNPLPVASIVPFIINKIETLENWNDITINVNPMKQTICVKNNKTKVKCNIPLDNKFEEMKAAALKFKPLELMDYSKLIKKALNYAYDAKHIIKNCKTL